MGRSFESVRIGVKEISDRWLKASRALEEGRSDLCPEASRDGQDALQ